MKYLSSLALLFVVLIAFVSCDKKITELDSTRPLEEIQEEADNMNVSELSETIKLYAGELEDNRAKLDKVKNRIRDLTPPELFGQAGLDLKQEMNELKRHRNRLLERLLVYQDKKKEWTK